jgi:hypothetical protein
VVRLAVTHGGVTWRRAQIVLLSALGMAVPTIAEVALTSEDRVRDVTGNFNADRSHQAAQDPHPVPGILPLSAVSLPVIGPDRDHLR